MTYFLLFQKASTNILLYFIAIGHTAHPNSKAPYINRIINRKPCKTDRSQSCRIFILCTLLFTETVFRIQQCKNITFLNITVYALFTQVPSGNISKGFLSGSSICCLILHKPQYNQNLGNLG